MEKKMNIHLWMYKVDDAISLMNIKVDDVSFDNFSPTAWLMMCINLKGVEYVKEKKIAHFLEFACSMQLTHKMSQCIQQLCTSMMKQETQFMKEQKILSN